MQFCRESLRVFWLQISNLHCMQEKNFHNFIIDKALHPEIEMHIKYPCKEEMLVNDLDVCFFVSI